MFKMINKELQKLYWTSLVSCIIWATIFVVRAYTYPEKTSEHSIFIVDIIGTILGAFFIAYTVTEAFHKNIASSTLSDFNKVMFTLFIGFAFFYFYKEVRRPIDYIYWRIVLGAIEWLMFGAGVYLGTLIPILAARNRKALTRRNQIKKVK